MIQDNNQHVIVAQSYGNYSAYPCTLANAQKLLAQHLDTLSDEVRELSAQDRADKLHAINQDRICLAFDEVLTKEVGSPTRSLRALLHGNAPGKDQEDTRPEVLVTQEMKDSLVLWCFKHKLNPERMRSIDCGLLTKALKERTLPLSEGLVERANGREMRVVESWVLEAANELALLQAGDRWKETAKEHSVVQRYLQFIEQHLVDTSDTRYHVASLSDVS